MANTFSQIYIQIVFSVKRRAALIGAEWREELHKYITGIVQNKGHKMLAVNGTSDHIHIFVGMKPDEALSALVREIKANSSKWINEYKMKRGRFEWQEGYGAFSYSRAHIGNVVNYIRTQQEHHKKAPFREEYVEFLQRFDVSYDRKYLFDIEE